MIYVFFIERIVIERLKIETMSKAVNQFPSQVFLFP